MQLGEDAAEKELKRIQKKEVEDNFMSLVNVEESQVGGILILLYVALSRISDDNAWDQIPTMFVEEFVEKEYSPIVWRSVFDERLLNAMQFIAINGINKYFETARAFCDDNCHCGSKLLGFSILKYQPEDGRVRTPDGCQREWGFWMCGNQ